MTHASSRKPVYFDDIESSNSLTQRPQGSRNSRRRRAMVGSLIAATCVALGLLAPPASAAEPRSSSSADIKRRIEEQKRRMDARQKEIDALVRKHRSSAPRPSNSRSTTSRPVAPPLDSRALDEFRRRTAAMRPAERSKTPPFNASRAPAPEKSLAEYVSAARSATSMEQLLRYLPEGEAQSLKDYQATHDPALAAQRRADYRREGKLDEAGIAHLTSPPYTTALKRHREIAKQTLAVLRVEIDGDRAKIEVSTSNAATINGARYPYSTGTYDLVGEGSAWKIDGYNDGNVYYLDPPAKRPAAKPKSTQQPAQKQPAATQPAGK
jgi:hypothetical protein